MEALGVHYVEGLAEGVVMVLIAALVTVVAVFYLVAILVILSSCREELKFVNAELRNLDHVFHEWRTHQ